MKKIIHIILFNIALFIVAILWMINLSENHGGGGMESFAAVLVVPITFVIGNFVLWLVTFCFSLYRIKNNKQRYLEINSHSINKANYYLCSSSIMFAWQSFSLIQGLLYDNAGLFNMTWFYYFFVFLPILLLFIISLKNFIEKNIRNDALRNSKLLYLTIYNLVPFILSFFDFLEDNIF